MHERKLYIPNASDLHVRRTQGKIVQQIVDPDISIRDLFV